MENPHRSTGFAGFFRELRPAEPKPGVRSSGAVAEVYHTRMKKYRGWPAFPQFLNECAQAALEDVLVTPPIAAAILGYSKVSIRRILDQEEIASWGWYESDKFHASEIFVSVRSLVGYGLKKGRLGDYDDEAPLRAVMGREVYAALRRSLSDDPFPTDL